jgi:hypothetical protein
LKHIFDSKDEKISDKAFVQSVVISVIGILLCIVALCSATFCWFTDGTQSNSNTLTSGRFDLQIEVIKQTPLTDASAQEGTEGADGATTTPETIEINEQSGVFTCVLPKGTYTVRLSLTEDSNVKGHCLVWVGDGEAMHTDAVIDEQNANYEGNAYTNPFVFTITVTETTEVRFEPRWGVVVEPDIDYGDVYPMHEENNNEQQADHIGETS